MVWLLGISYDPKDDIIEIALEGVDHLIPKPREVYVEENGASRLSMRRQAPDHRSQRSADAARAGAVHGEGELIRQPAALAAWTRHPPIPPVPNSGPIETQGLRLYA
jgi:hypothetical protein